MKELRGRPIGKTDGGGIFIRWLYSKLNGEMQSVSMFNLSERHSYMCVKAVSSETWFPGADLHARMKSPNCEHVSFGRGPNKNCWVNLLQNMQKGDVGISNRLENQLSLGQ